MENNNTVIKKISVIVPCYNEELTINKFYETATPILDMLNNMTYEIIFVNDGSKDKTLDVLDSLAKIDSRVKVVSFSRNFGQQAAIICGFRHASGDCAVELDCDLQDPVEVVLEMVEKWREGYDVVHGRRIKRNGESLFKKLTANLYYKFLEKICATKMPRDTGDFKLIDRKVIDVLCALSEHDKYLRGLESWVGFKQTFVDFTRAERVAGETHYTLKKMFKLAKAGIVSNSDYPLSLSFKGSIFFTLNSIICFITFIILSILKVKLPLLAWVFPTIGLLFGVNFIYKAISDMYLAKIYEEVKNRPEYIISKTINID